VFVVAVNPGDAARWAGLLSVAALALIVIVYGSSPRRPIQTGRPQNNLEAQTPAGVRATAASAIDALKANPWLLPTVLVIIFTILTIVRPANLFPTKGDVQKGSAPQLALTLSVESNRHLEEGDSVQLRLDVQGTTSNKGACMVSDPAGLSANAIAPGTDLATVNEFTFDRRHCIGFATWIVAIKKGGDFVVATTIARKSKTTVKTIGSVDVDVSSEQSGVTSDALLSTLITALVALLSFLKNAKA
jgi:hypothetical protein